MNKDIGGYLTLTIFLALICIAAVISTPLEIPQDIAVNKEDVTVQIVGAEWTGSGFILEDGIVVTAAHVLYDIIEARVILSDGMEIYLDPNTYMIDGVWDVAIAKIPGYGGPCAVLGDNDSIIIGAGIELVGYPLGEKLWHSFGEIARLEKGGNIDIDCDANPGNSGGPIFIEDEVAGIITCGYTSTDISMGIAVNVIKNMIDRYKILKD